MKATAKMKNIYEVIRQKELAANRLTTEVNVLRTVLPMLADNKETTLATTDSATQNSDSTLRTESDTTQRVSWLRFVSRLRAASGAS